MLWKAEKEHPRAYNAAGPGKSAHTAVALQNLLVEGTPSSCEAAMALLDLVKAYELDKHVKIVDGADEMGFPRAILGLLFVIFGAPRRIVIDGCVSEEVRVLGSTILAGSVFGLLLLRLALHAPLDW